MVNSICRISTACPGTDQHASATTQRDHQGAAGCPQKIVHAMIPAGQVDLHSVSGDRRLKCDDDDEVRGYGIRRASLLRRGHTHA
eukprot:6608070-Pyramimonas_sp.AAC.1